MFERFQYAFNAVNETEKSDQIKIPEQILDKAIGSKEFFQNFEGQVFNKGLYRVHKLSEIEKWNDIIVEAFPAYQNKILCFSYDWLGRHFALDFTRIYEQEPLIVMFEPGTLEALEIPSTFLTFHEEELVDYSNAALARDFFFEWRKTNNFNSLERDKCVGYKNPLFLGGR